MSALDKYTVLDVIPADCSETVAPSPRSVLPCPFCNGKEIGFIRYRHPCGGIRFAVHCFVCQAEVDRGFSQDLSTARQYWNTRKGMLHD